MSLAISQAGIAGPIVAVVGAPISSGAEAQVSFETLVLSGQLAPGAGGAVFESFGVPAVNPSGDLDFYAKLEEGVGGVDSDNDTSIWVLPAGGVLTARAREGSLIESGADPGDQYGHIIEGFGHPRIDSTGQIAFYGRHRHVTVSQFTDYLALFGPGVSVAMAGSARRCV